ncbi:Auxin-responsive protein IAA27 [Apostasia shenzhenica]|uniref:Auxin-responsive protein n=1 Tax=Apostasia shenzhenica TaxID=1088818 RepID=A0A2I0AFX4_9ASPA|nr:Auxin-responsive protein IAA27 [Apostasia shenzhenica]
MSPPLEHDYIGLAEVSSMESSSDVGERPESLRQTELRLGLPGSESPERREKPGFTLDLLSTKDFAVGSKRGFSGAVEGSGKWVFSGSSASEVEMDKGSALFSTRSGGSCGGGGKEMAGKAMVVQEKKQQGPPAAKAQVVGWPPIRSYRKNTMTINPNKEDSDGKNRLGCLYVKVGMDGAPYLRKIDLKTYFSYKELSLALEKMFSGFTIGHCGSQYLLGKDGSGENHLTDILNGSEYMLTYEDKDGDWMLVGDVPWEMFINSCRRLRIMKGSDAIGLAPRAKEKNETRN